VSWIVAGLAALVFSLAFARYLRAVIVYEYQSGLRYRSGRLGSVLGPGRYWINPTVSQIHLVDMRTRILTVPGQEILSTDGVTLKVSLAVRFRVTDPVTATHGTQDYQGALYQQLQTGLRAIVGGAPIDQVLEKRAEFGATLLASTTAEAERLGLVLEAVEIKDIMFPGELKKVFTEVVRARQAGLAALERARGETAALRNLANAAELLGKNPALLTLRSLHALSESPNATLVLNTADGRPEVAHGGAHPGPAPA
jgi:regulator of protease activity HflC (stomatin/prohibitin superfamily)